MANDPSGWVTPISPPVRGKMWCVHAQRGVYEWLLHPEDAREMLEGGVVLNGDSCRVSKVCEWPSIGRWHIQVTTPLRASAWTDAAAA